MAKTILQEVTPTHDEIAAQAYEIYLREGSVPGRDLDNWLKAEAELRARSNGNGNGNGNGNANGNGSLYAEAPTQNPRGTAPRRAAKR